MGAKKRAANPDEGRMIAFQLVQQVNRDGAYANIRLPEILAKSRCDERDRAFATELAYGTLRMQGKLDFAIKTKIDRPFESLDTKIIDLLRLGLHQIYEMRVPDHAAVSATVELAKFVAGESKASYVNAILRSVLRDPPNFEVMDDLSTKYSHPDWIVRSLSEKLGDSSRLESLLQAHNKPVAPHLVAWPGKSTVEELIEEGAEPISYSRFGAKATKMPGSYTAVHERRAGVQDFGSQLISELFFNTAGESEYLSWLDMCAGPGGKSALLHALLKENRPKDHFTANEPTPHRAELVKHVVPPEKVISFLGQDLPKLGTTYDRILVDAPCSGLGALRRRPESRWRKTPQDLNGLITLQRELLDSAVKILRSGGLIAYVTCSPHRSETNAQVLDFLNRHISFTLEKANTYIPTAAESLDVLESDGSLQMWSDLHGTDSMYLALLRDTKAVG